MLRSLIVLSLVTSQLFASEFASNLVYAGSSATSRVIVFDLAGKQVTAVGGASALKEPGALTFAPDGRLYVLNKQSGLVHGINGNGSLESTFGTIVGLSKPTAITVTPRGSLLIADEDASTLVELGLDGSLIGIFGDSALIPKARDLAYSPDGHLFVASAEQRAVLEYAPDGTLLATLGSGLGLTDPASIAFDAQGHLFISSGDTDEIVVLDREGALLDRIGAETGLEQPGGLGFTADGSLAVVSRGTDEVIFLSTDGELLASGGKNYAGGDDLAIAPRRFSFRTTGTLTTDKGERIKARQDGAISLQPGGLQIMLELDELVSNNDLVSTFGTRYMVLDGYEAFADDSEQRRLFQGTWSPSNESGAGSISLAINGKVGKKDGIFEVKKAKGTLMRSGPEGVFSGKATSRKALK